MKRLTAAKRKKIGEKISGGELRVRGGQRDGPGRVHQMERNEIWLPEGSILGKILINIKSGFCVEVHL